MSCSHFVFRFPIIKFTKRENEPLIDVWGEKVSATWPSHAPKHRNWQEIELNRFEYTAKGTCFRHWTCGIETSTIDDLRSAFKEQKIIQELSCSYIVTSRIFTRLFDSLLKKAFKSHDSLDSNGTNNPHSSVCEPHSIFWWIMPQERTKPWRKLSIDNETSIVFHHRRIEANESNQVEQNLFLFAQITFDAHDDYLLNRIRSNSFWFANIFDLYIAETTIEAVERAYLKVLSTTSMRQWIVQINLKRA